MSCHVPEYVWDMLQHVRHWKLVQPTSFLRVGLWIGPGCQNMLCWYGGSGVGKLEGGVLGLPWPTSKCSGSPMPRGITMTWQNITSTQEIMPFFPMLPNYPYQEYLSHTIYPVPGGANPLLPGIPTTLPSTWQTTNSGIWLAHLSLTSWNSHESTYISKYSQSSVNKRLIQVKWTWWKH
jgi:hypothetical protein